MNTIATFLSGKKTYIVALVAAGIAFAQAMGWHVPDGVWTVLAAAGLGTLRAAIAKTDQ